ncbi:MAG: LysM peptidoglycan-binding domain-containing protein [Bryobacterales bacterium]|nr:LysM peptidoglycan-binding domain-containing protein [Bryobacterales bacterium]
MSNYSLYFNSIQSYPNEDARYESATVYQVTYGGSVPTGSRVYLCVDQPSNRMEVFRTWNKGVQLPELLRLFRRCVKWGQDVDCWLVAEGGASTVTSNVKQIRTTVQPMWWPTNTRKISNEVPVLTYPGNGWGRVFSDVYDGVRYFFIAGGFETKPAMRGFDCTTFPEALYCDKFPYIPGKGPRYPDLSTGHSGPKIADALGAQKCKNGQVEMEGVSGETLRDFLLTREDEISVYLVWRHYSHVLLCKIDCNTNSRWFHEFNNGGYIKTPVAERELDGTFTARLLPPKDFDFTNRVETLAGQQQQQSKPGKQPGAGGPGSGGPSAGAPGGGAGGGSGNGGNGGGNGGGGGGGQVYVVKSGDSLSLISGRFWGDVLLWPILYDANRSVVGPDPNKIVPNQKLTVPSIKNYSSQQLSDARSRGKNWR